MERPGRRKQFVRVVANHEIDGSIQFLRIILGDGRSFEVDDSRDPYWGKSKPSGVSLKYPVTIGGKKTELYEDNGRFWVLVKE